MVIGRFLLRCFFIVFVSCFGFSQKAFSQYEGENAIGIKAGASMTMIKNMSQIFVIENYYDNYSFKDLNKVSPAATLFYNYRQTDAFLGVEFDVNWFMHHDAVEYSDINGLNYTVDFKFHYVGVGAYIKCYLHEGLFLAPGCKFGICLNPDGVTYESNQDDPKFEKYGYYSEEKTAFCVNDKVKGRSCLGVGGMIGYEFINGLSVQFDYHYGLLDEVETQTNVYNWVEERNRSHSFQLMVGYAFTFGQ